MESASKRFYLLTVLGAMCAGAVVRLAFLNYYGPWFDEIYFAVFARPWQTGGVNGSFDLFVWLGGNDVHPPVYFLILLYWLKLFGQSAVAIRLPSLFFGLATIPAAYGFVREALGRRAGALTAWLVALSPAAVLFSVEARPYALLALLVTLSCWLLWRAMQNGDRQSALGYLLLAPLMTGTHHLGWFVFAGQLVLAAALLSRKAENRRFIWMPIAAAVLGLPFLLMSFSQSGTSFRHLTKTTPAAVGEMLNFVSPESLVQPAWLRWPLHLALAVLVLGAAVSIASKLRKKDEATGRVGLFFLAFLLVPLVALVAVASVRPLLNEKLGILLLAPALAAPAWAATRLPWRWLRAAAIVVLLSASLWSLAHLGEHIRQTPDYRAAAAYLATPQTRDQSVVLASTWWNGTYLYYDGGERAIFAHDKARLADLLRRRQPFFLLVEDVTSDAKIVTGIVTGHYDIRLEKAFHRLSLYRLTPVTTP